MDEVLASCLVDATLLSPEMPGSFVVSAVVTAPIAGSFGVQASVPGWSDFPATATILATMSGATPVDPTLSPDTSDNAVDWFPSLRTGETLSVGPTVSTTFLADTFSPVYSGSGRYRVWYKLVIPPGGSLTAQFDTIGSDFDTVLTIYRDTFDTYYAGDDDSVGDTYGTSKWTGTLAGGHTWYVLSCSYSGTGGNLYVRTTPIVISGQVPLSGFRASAAIVWHFEPTFAVAYQWTPGGSFTVNAVKLKTIDPLGMAYVPLVLSDTPLHYWRFEETVGTSATDIGSSPIDGTIKSGVTTGVVVPVPAPPGTAFSFPADTTTGYVWMNGVSVNYAAYSIEAWVNLTSGDNGAIAGRGYNPGLMLYWSGGTVYVYHNGSSVAATLSSGAWHHVVATFDGSFVRIYVDGVMTGGPASIGAPTDNNSYVWAIGGYNATSSSVVAALNGLIDEVAFYNYALSPTQISGHFTSSRNSVGVFPVSAVIVPWRFWSYATIFKNNWEKTFVAAAVIRKPDNLGSFPVDYQWGPGGSFLVAAIRLSHLTGKTYTEIVSTDAPLHYWKLEETSGTVAADIGSSPISGTIKSGVTLGNASRPVTPGGTAFRFPSNTTTGYVWMNGVSVNYAAYSIEAWVNLTSGDGAIAGRGYSPGLMLYWYSGTVYVYHDGQGPNMPLSAGSWHHVVLTFDGSSLRLYVDGVAGTPYARSGAPSDNNSYVWAIGGYNATSSSVASALNGLIDEVAFYNYALSPAQISAHFSGTSEVGLIRVSAMISNGHFRLDAYFVGAIVTRSVIKKPDNLGSFPVNYQWGPGGSFTVAAVILATRSGVVGAPPLWSDDFSRTVTYGSGFGGAWTPGYASNAGVDGQLGYVNASYAYFYNATVDALVPDTLETTIEFLTLPIGGSTNYYLQWGLRRSYFEIYPWVTIADPSDYQVYLWAAGNNASTNVSITPATWYRARLQQGASTVRLKIWKRIDPEPETWLLTQTRSGSSTTTFLELDGYGYAAIDNVAIWTFGSWGYSPGLLVDALLEHRKFTAGATLRKEQLRTLTVNAVIRKPDTLGSFPVDYQWGPGGSFPAASIRQVTILGSTNQILGSNPAAYWPFSDPTTTTATELISGKNATSQTPANVSSVVLPVIGSGWQWSAQSYLSSTFYQPSTSVATFECWIKTTSTGELWQGRYGSSGSGGRGITVTLNANGFGSIAGRVNVFINSDNIWYGRGSVQAVNDGNLHHIVATWDGSNGQPLSASQFSIWIDGQPATTFDHTNNGGTYYAPFTGNTTQGRFLGSNYGVYTGFASNLAFYTRALTLDEIQRHYLGTTGLPVWAWLRPMFFLTDAFFVGTVYGTFPVRAVIRKPGDTMNPMPALAVDYQWGSGGSFTVNGIRLKTFSPTGSLAFPGTNSAGVGPGGAANLLTPAPIRANPGDTVSITFTALSGGNIGFFAGPTDVLAQMTQNSWTNVGALPFTFSAALSGGNYYFWPYSWTYDANKTGAGYFTPSGGLFASATLRKTISPTFSVEYEWKHIVTSSFEAGAWIKATMTFGPSGTAIIRPNRDIDTNGAVNHSSGTTAWNLVDEAVLDQNDWINPTYGGGGDNLGYVAMGFTRPEVLPGYTVNALTITAYITCGAPSFGADIWIRNPATGTRYVVISQGQQSSGYYSATLTTRPWDSQPWTGADLANLVIGNSINYGYNGFQGFYLRQLYATVDWTLPSPAKLDAVKFRHDILGSGFTVGARVGGYGTIDAEIWPRHFWLQAQIGYWFRAEAEIAPMRFPASALFLASFGGTFTAGALKFRTLEQTFTANAVITRTITPVGFTLNAAKSGRILVNAVILAARYGSWATDAIRRETFVYEDDDPLRPGLKVDGRYMPGGDVIVYAWVQPYFYVNASFCLEFHLNAVILSHRGAPSFLPLAFPGTSQTFLGNAANTLTPDLWISPGEPLTVGVVSPPSDGGSLDAFNSSLILNYPISTDVGEHVTVVLPGSYTVNSAKDNHFRPLLNGAGYYSNWGVSSLSFTIGAFVLPTFRVDANLVWTWHSPEDFPPLTAEALVMARRTRSFVAATYIQPFFIVQALIVPRHFHADAWIKCEFRINAWLIRRVTGTFAVSAFVRPVFRINAIKRKVQGAAGEKTFTIGAFKTAPVFGYFSISSWVLAYFKAGASFRVTKYRRFKADAWRDFKITSSFSANAFIKTYFYAKAVIYRPAEALDPIPSFTLKTHLVKLVFGDFTVGAFIDGWFTARAIRGKTFERSFLVKASIVWLKSSPGDFAPLVMDASITGFLVNAVIKGFGGVGIGGQTYVFKLYALKGQATRTKTFLAQAEKRDPGAYWDQEWEIWRHLHLLADAHIQATRLRSLSLNAAIVLEGMSLVSFYIDSWLRATNLTGSFTLEADVVPLYFTVTYEGIGKTAVVRNFITERLSFPGSHTPAEPSGNLSADNANLLSGPIYPIVGTPVTVTLWEFPFGSTWLDIVSRDEHQGMVGVLPAGPGTFVFWPSYFYEPHYVWASQGVYNPLLAGSGLVSFYRDDAVTLARPAPTMDAWVVGTIGTPFTIDAEVVGTTKHKGFVATAEIFGVGERRGTLGVDALVVGRSEYFLLVAASLQSMGFSADAELLQPSFSLDAWVGPYFVAKATIKKTRAWSPGPRIDAILAVPRKTSSFTVAADIAGVGEHHNFIVSDAIVLGPRVQRIYLAAYVGLDDRTFSLDAMIGYRFTVGSWVGSDGGGMGGFHANAYIRGNAYIIFPSDGGPRTDLYGNPPMIGRSFKVKIEAFIPDAIPMGNDPEIERLILLILEAEAELEAMYCAYIHYTPQGATAKVKPAANQTSPNPSGTGYTGGALPGTISQIGYLGAGDIDDCWCVATIWAAKAAGVPDWHVSVTEYRHWARNPDRPGSTGGSALGVYRGAVGCWPNAKIRRYHSSSWDGFISLLKTGWIGSLCIRAGALPSRLQHGFKGLHQVGIAYYEGKYYIADPLAPNNSRPREITGAEIRKAARGFSGTTIYATLIS